MPQWLGGWRTWGIGALAGVCATAGAWAGPAATSRPVAPRASLSRPAASQAAATQPVPIDLEAAHRACLADENLQKDPETLFQVATQCVLGNRPDLAADLYRRVLDVRPAHTRARALLRVSNLRLAAASRPASTSQPASRPADNHPVLTIAGVLSPEGINRIRVREFRHEDMTDRPRVTMSRQVMQEFLAEADKSQWMSEDNRSQFQQSDNDDKFRWMISLAGERYLDRVQVTRDPQSMAAFRQKVWPIISKGCAAPNCHGGDQAGHLRFVLPITYGPAMSTNFYIASRFEGAEGKLVDRENPEASLLLQYALPADQAEFKHPLVRPAVMTGTNDGKYQVVLEWIRQLRSPVPDYQITDRMWQSFPSRPTAPPVK